MGSHVMGCGVSKTFTDWTDEVTEDVKKSFDSVLQIVEVAQKVKTFDDAPYDSNIFLLIALLNCGQNNFENSHGVSVTDLNAPDKEDDFLKTVEDDKRFCKFATNIYLASWKWTKEEIAET